MKKIMGMVLVITMLFATVAVSAGLNEDRSVIALNVFVALLGSEKNVSLIFDTKISGAYEDDGSVFVLLESRLSYEFFSIAEDDAVNLVSTIWTSMNSVHSTQSDAPFFLAITHEGEIMYFITDSAIVDVVSEKMLIAPHAEFI